ncbi:GIP [Symbiodinium sp. CCMP2592]|nr:GIP [Symbiodinium sp. CCMP2592]
MPLSRPRPLGGDGELLSPEAKKMQQELPNLSEDDTMANAAMCYLSPLGQRSKALSATVSPKTPRRPMMLPALYSPQSSDVRRTVPSGLKSSGVTSPGTIVLAPPRPVGHDLDLPMIDQICRSSFQAHKALLQWQRRALAAHRRAWDKAEKLEAAKRAFKAPCRHLLCSFERSVAVKVPKEDVLMGLEVHRAVLEDALIHLAETVQNIIVQRRSFENVTEAHYDTIIRFGQITEQVDVYHPVWADLVEYYPELWTAFSDVAEEPATGSGARWRPKAAAKAAGSGGAASSAPQEEEQPAEEASAAPAEGAAPGAPTPPKAPALGIRGPTRDLYYRGRSDPLRQRRVPAEPEQIIEDTGARASSEPPAAEGEVDLSRAGGNPAEDSLRSARRVRTPPARRAQEEARLEELRLRGSVFASFRDAEDAEPEQAEQAAGEEETEEIEVEVEVAQGDDRGAAEGAPDDEPATEGRQAEGAEEEEAAEEDEAIDVHPASEATVSPATSEAAAPTREIRVNLGRDDAWIDPSSYREVYTASAPATPRAPPQRRPFRQGEIVEAEVEETAALGTRCPHRSQRTIEGAAPASKVTRTGDEGESAKDAAATAASTKAPPPIVTGNRQKLAYHAWAQQTRDEENAEAAASSAAAASSSQRVLATRTEATIVFDWHHVLDKACIESRGATWDTKPGSHGYFNTEFVAALKDFCEEHKPLRLAILSYSTQSTAPWYRFHFLEEALECLRVALPLSINLSIGQTYQRTGPDGKAQQLCQIVPPASVVIDDNRGIIKECAKTGALTVQAQKGGGVDQLIYELNQASALIKRRTGPAAPACVPPPFCQLAVPEGAAVTHAHHASGVALGAASLAHQAAERAQYRDEAQTIARAAQGIVDDARLADEMESMQRRHEEAMAVMAERLTRIRRIIQLIVLICDDPAPDGDGAAASSAAAPKTNAELEEDTIRVKSLSDLSFPNPPQNAAQARGFVNQTLMAIGKLQKTPGDEVYIWAQDCLKKEPAALCKDGRFPRLDREIAAKLIKVCRHGRFGLLFQQMVESERLKSGGMPNGRCMLRAIYSHFQLERDRMGMLAERNLLNIRIGGDGISHLEAFRDKYHYVANTIPVEDLPKDSTIFNHLIDEFEKVSVLKPKVEKAREARPGSHRRTAAWLWNRVDIAIDLHQQRVNRQEFDKSLQQKPETLTSTSQPSKPSVPATPAPGAAAGAPKGGATDKPPKKEKKKKKKKKKDEGEPEVEVPGAPAPKGKGKGGKGGKGNGTPRSPKGGDTTPRSAQAKSARNMTPEEKAKTPCMFWAFGACKGDPCPFLHDSKNKYTGPKPKSLAKPDAKAKPKAKAKANAATAPLINALPAELNQDGKITWLWDTAAGRHLIGRQALSSKALSCVTRSETPVGFATGGGAREGTHSLAFEGSRLLPSEEQVYVLKECPPAFSVGKAVLDEGSLFVWDPREHRPYFVKKEDVHRCKLRIPRKARINATRVVEYVPQFEETLRPAVREQSPSLSPITASASPAPKDDDTVSFSDFEVADLEEAEASYPRTTSGDYDWEADVVEKHAEKKAEAKRLFREGAVGETAASESSEEELFPELFKGKPASTQQPAEGTTAKEAASGLRANEMSPTCLVKLDEAGELIVAAEEDGTARGGHTVGGPHKGALQWEEGLFLGWRIDAGMRYRNVVKVLDYNDFRGKRNTSVHDVPEPELYIEDGPPIFPVANATRKALVDGSTLSAASGALPEIPLREIPFALESIGPPAPRTPGVRKKLLQGGLRFAPWVSHQRLPRCLATVHCQYHELGVPHVRLAKETLDVENELVAAQLHEQFSACPKSHLWVSLPCTSGCQWHRVQLKRGGGEYRARLLQKIHGSKKLFAQFVEHAKTALDLGIDVTFEWPRYSDSWKRPDVKEFFKARGKDLELTGLYTQEMCERIAFAINPSRAYISVPAMPVLPTSTTTEHREKEQELKHVSALSGYEDLAAVIESDQEASKLVEEIVDLSALMCAVHGIPKEAPSKEVSAMVTKLLSRAEMLSSPEALNAVKQEADGLRAVPVWDETNPQEYASVQAQARRTGTKVHFGKLMSIASIKFWELAKHLQKVKGRIVYRGDCAKDEEGAAAVYRELGANPTSVQGLNACLAYGSLPGHQSSAADAVKAYVQALLKSKYQTWIELPPELRPAWWRECFAKPVVLLLRALYGHPEAGGLWEKHLKEVLRNMGGQELPEYPGNFRFPETKLLLSTYVDDLTLSGPQEEHQPFWDALCKVVDVEPPEPVYRILGRNHCTINAEPEGTENAALGALRGAMAFDMFDYAQQTVDLYKGLTGLKALKHAATPFAPEASLPVSQEEIAGELAPNACKVLMKALWLGRLARPDLVKPIGDLATKVQKWSRNDDKKLLRLISYIDSTKTHRLVGTVSDGPRELHLALYVDADFAGERDDAKSTSGGFLVLKGPNTFFPLAWVSKRQTSVSRSTTESEIVSLAHSLFQEALPALQLWQTILDYPIRLIIHEDNQATILVAKKGYSPKLRHIARTHKVNLGSISEVIDEDDVDIEYVDTNLQAADIFTKALPPQKWDNALKLLGMRQNLPEILVDTRQLKTKAGSGPTTSPTSGSSPK